MQIRLILATIVLTTVGMQSAVAFDADPVDGLRREARQLTARFAKALKSELKKALKEEGPAQAIEICHLKAPDIAKDLSDQTGWNIRRTSLKVRNLEDAPDKWENQVLERFEKMNAADAPEDAMEYSEIVADKRGRKVFRYMKAIPARRICLKCHGETIARPVQKQLDSLYPFDQATGFTEDDLRGAFSLSKPMD